MDKTMENQLEAGIMEFRVSGNQRSCFGGTYEKDCSTWGA